MKFCAPPFKYISGFHDFESDANIISKFLTATKNGKQILTLLLNCKVLVTAVFSPSPSFSMTDKRRRSFAMVTAPCGPATLLASRCRRGNTI